MRRYLVLYLVGLSAFGVSAGLLSSLAGFFKGALTLPFWSLALACVYSVGVIPAGCWWANRSARNMRDPLFLLLLAALCLFSRLAIGALFPSYVLTGDEVYLHRFVSALASGGLTNGNLAELSSLYDYPVWLSRAFPFYYFFRLIFGNSDLNVVRAMNALWDTGTLVFAFFIARRLAGSLAARIVAWLLAVFPGHVFDTLSYTPQLPGTFLFVTGVWLVISGIRLRGLAWRQVLWRGAALGTVLFLMRVQRGGLDLLLLGLIGALYLLYSMRIGPARFSMRSLAGIVLAVGVWLPSAYVFDSWVSSHDVHQIRSHFLGFMTRGSNPVTMGEYLLRYEQLDIASPPESKKKVLLSLLVSEAVYEPAVTFGLVPVVKTAKFFLLGYASPAEQGLEQGGYRTAALAAKALRLTYAPVVLLFCLAGLIASLSNPSAMWRLCVPVVTLVLSAAAIVLLWESSPRYSHCVHFALLTLAAVGFRTLAKRRLFSNLGAWRLVCVRALMFAGVTCILWFGASFALYALSRGASNLLYLDMRKAAIEIGERPAEMSPFHRWTGAWEQMAVLRAGTSLPARLKISWPAGAQAQKASGLSMSIWVTAPAAEPWASCRIVLPSMRGSKREYTIRELATMKRGLWAVQKFAAAKPSIELTVLPPRGERDLVFPESVTLGLGYVLAEQVSPDAGAGGVSASIFGRGEASAMDR